MLWSTGTPWQRVKYSVPTGISGLTPTGKRERYPPNFGQKTQITPLHFLGTKHLYEPHRTCTILCLFQF